MIKTLISKLIQKIKKFIVKKERPHYVLEVQDSTMNTRGEL